MACFVIPLQAQLINELDNLGGLLVNNELVLILGVLDIAIGSKGIDILAVAPLVVKHLPDFFEGLITIVVVHNVGDRDDNVGNAVGITLAVHVLGKADKADIHLHEQVFNQAPGVAVIPGKPGKVFDDHTFDFSAHYVGQKPLKVLAVGVGAGVPIVHILGYALKLVNVLLIVFIEQIALVFDAVAVVLALPGLFQIFLGEPDIFTQFPAPDGVRGEIGLLIPSVFCACHCSSFPITLHLYYTSVRGEQQGCRHLGTFCLEVKDGP
jgi:hypothetical protein